MVGTGTGKSRKCSHALSNTDQKTVAVADVLRDLFSILTMVRHQKQKTCQKQADTGDDQRCRGKADQILSDHANEPVGIVDTSTRDTNFR